MFTAAEFDQQIISWNIWDALFSSINKFVFLKFIELQSVNGAVTLNHAEQTLWLTSLDRFYEIRMSRLFKSKEKCWQLSGKMITYEGAA